MNSMCNDLYNTLFFMKQLVTREHKVNYINKHKSEFLKIVSTFYSHLVQNTSLYKNMSVDKNVINLNLIYDMKKYIFKEGDNYFIYFTTYTIEKNDENYITRDRNFDYFAIDCDKNGFISKQTINDYINKFAKSKYKHSNDTTSHNEFIQNLKKDICVNKSNTVIIPTTTNIGPEKKCLSFNQEPDECTSETHYRSQSRIFHPDKNPGCIDEAITKLRKLHDMSMCSQYVNSGHS
jgi:hypothetical protein